MRWRIEPRDAEGRADDSSRWIGNASAASRKLMSTKGGLEGGERSSLRALQTGRGCALEAVGVTQAGHLKVPEPNGQRCRRPNDWVREVPPKAASLNPHQNPPRDMSRTSPQRPGLCPDASFRDQPAHRPVHVSARLNCVALHELGFGMMDALDSHFRSLGGTTWSAGMGASTAMVEATPELSLSILDTMPDICLLVFGLSQSRVEVKDKCLV